MGVLPVRALFRLSFTDYVPDPSDADCLRRSMTVPADQITFEDATLILWLADTEIARFELSTIVTIKIEDVPANGRRDAPEELRSRYPNFGQPWTSEDEANLLTLYREGERDFDALGKKFGRQPSAIRSRLSKLGLEHL
ncbi:MULTISPECIES: hypothetical protein [unclassified Streptomyces]|uniref:hypothetical protein n=1 Tax=unclassified Streptomyces TaxID=2593676 RepID=UPI003652B78A